MRPEGWNNPNPSIESGLPTNDWCYSQYDLAREYEAGADAMLEGLKKETLNCTFDENFQVIGGKLVFIPEE